MVFTLGGALKKTMVKTITVAGWGLVLAGLLWVDPVAAQQQAPIGHRQPTASEVPANDSIRGDAGLAGDAAVANHMPQKSKKRARSRRVQSNVDVIMKTPNICSNCNQ
jgi:hypothetical protein